MLEIIRKNNEYIVRILLIILTVFVSYHVNIQAADRSWEGDDANYPTKWEQAGNWSGNLVPNDEDTVIIASYVTGQPVMYEANEAGELRINSDETGTVTLDLNGQELKVTAAGGLSGNTHIYSGAIVNLTNSTSVLQTESLQIDSGGTIDGTGSQATIYCGGSWSNNGTFNTGNTTVVLDAISGTPAITAQNNLDFYNLVVDSDLTVAMSSNIDIGCSLAVVNGKLDVNTYRITIEE
ncbi:MAG: hypothetical protein PHV82_15225 [Victivallaceae bacterium]|nr:hypothetical protein [Victivallaceae bacterium]